MAINFPNSPSTNDTYVAAGSRWLWNGTAWVRQGTPGTQGVQGATGATGPTGAQGHQGADGPNTIDDFIVHNGDTNTKFGFAAADTFTVETAGSERLRIGTTGISTFTGDISLTAGGAERLNLAHVSGGDVLIKNPTDAYIAFGTNDTERLRIANTGKLSVTGSTANMEYLRMGGNLDRGLRFTSSTGTSSVGVVHTIDAPGDSGSQGTIVLQTNSSERLRIDSTGRLLKSGQASLNSTSLSHPIQVASASDANTIAIIGRAADDIGELSFYEADKSTKLGELQYRQDHLNFRHRVGDIRFATGGTTERLRILSDGKVAIGDVTANSLLDVHGGDGISITHSGDTFLQSRTTGTTGTNYLEFKDSGGGSGAISYHHDGDSLRFKVNGSERFRITSDGKVLIGSDTGSVHGNRLLQVGKTDRSETYFSIVTSTSGQSGILFADTTTNDTGGYRGQIRYHHSDDSMNFRTGATERLRITSGGDVVIGNSSAEDGAHFQHYTSGARHQSFQSTNGDLSIVTDNNTNPAVYIKGTGTADLLKVFDNTTQIFTIKDGGNVEVNGNIVMGNGNGIDFSADPDASGRESELLDDYEHGTFTPIIKVESSGSNAAIDNVSGTYVKVGKLVYASFHVELNGVPSGRSSSAAIEFYGMPFTSLAEGSSGVEEHIGSVRCHPVDNGTSLGACSEFIFRLFDNNTSGRVEARKSDGNLANASLYMRDDMQITAAITYRTAS